MQQVLIEIAAQVLGAALIALIAALLRRATGAGASTG